MTIYKTSEEIVRELYNIPTDIIILNPQDLETKGKKLWLSQEELKEIIERIDNMLVDSLEYPQQRYAFLLHKEDWKKLKKEVGL